MIPVQKKSPYDRKQRPLERKILRDGQTDERVPCGAKNEHFPSCCCCWIGDCCDLCAFQGPALNSGQMTSKSPSTSLSSSDSSQNQLKSFQPMHAPDVKRKHRQLRRFSARNVKEMAANSKEKLRLTAGVTK